MDGKKVFNNATWIIGLQIARSLVGVIISMITARYLGPSNFGLINYASSVIAFFTPIVTLGLNGILVHEIVNFPNKEGEILGTAITMSFISAIFCILGIISFTSIINRGEKETIIVCALCSISLFFQSAELIIYWFQAKLLSKYSSIASLIAYGAVSLYKIYLLVTQKSIRWFAVSSAFDYMIISALLIILYYRLSDHKLSFSWDTAKKMFSKSKYYIVANMTVIIFSETDKIMLKLMIGDTVTGYYSAAVKCALMTSFIFSAIIDSFRPIIFDSKVNNTESYELNLMRLYGIIIYLSLVQSICITFFSNLVINILYGAEYGPAVNVLRIIVWYTTFSYLGAVRNIWILAEQKQKYLLILNIAGAFANILLNLIFIPFMGIMGAALASLITQIYTNVVMGFILKPIRRNNKIMLKALNPMLTVKTAAHFLRKEQKND